MSLIRSAWAMVMKNKRAYILINGLYYGLVLAFMGVSAFNPDLQTELIDTVGRSFVAGPLAVVGDAYLNAEVLKAIGLTFLVNLFLASLLSISLPSLVIPFSGMLLGFFRAALWGLIFYPGHPSMRLVMIPHSLTLLLEGQAYVLVLLSVYLQGRAFIHPVSIGSTSHWKGFIEGLKQAGLVYLLVILTLLIAAIYEVLEVILMSRLGG